MVLPSTRRWLVTWFSMLHSGYNLDTIREDYYRDPPLSIHLKNNFPLPSCVAFNVIENSIHPSYLGGVAINMVGVATDTTPSSKSFVASGFNTSNIATVILHACPGIFLKYYEE